MKNYLKYIFILITCSNLIGCLHIKTPAENLQDLRDGKVGAVITGCSYYTENNSQIDCSTEWRSGDTYVFFTGYDVIKFIKPGTYKFNGYTMLEIGYPYNIHRSYKPKKSNPNIISDFTINPGEVIYIGKLEVDTRKTRILIHAMSIWHFKKENQLKNFKKYFPQYFNDNFQLDYKERFIGLTPTAIAAKAIPVLE
jgi:hypothetical protein